jgi:hypothetical protein
MAIDKDLLEQLLAGRDPKDLFSKDGLLEGLSGILCAGPVNIYWPMKRSPKMTANWTRASFHSRGGRFQSAAA